MWKKVLFGLLVLYTIMLTIYSIMMTVFFIQEIKNPCPKIPTCPDPKPCGKQIPTPGLINLLDMLSKDSSKVFQYSGIGEMQKILSITPKTYVMLSFSNVVKSIYDATILYTGTASLCTFSSNMNLANADVKKYSGTCDINYAVVYSNEKTQPYFSFLYRFNDCSKQVETNLGTLDMKYDTVNDNFYTVLNTKEQKVGIITIPSQKVVFNMTKGMQQTNDFSQSDITKWCGHIPGTNTNQIKFDVY